MITSSHGKKTGAETNSSKSVLRVSTDEGQTFSPIAIPSMDWAITTI
jgi:hypothetical protein